MQAQRKCLGPVVCRNDQTAIQIKQSLAGKYGKEVQIKVDYLIVSIFSFLFWRRYHQNFLLLPNKISLLPISEIVNINELERLVLKQLL